MNVEEQRQLMERTVRASLGQFVGQPNTQETRDKITQHLNELLRRSGFVAKTKTLHETLPFRCWLAWFFHNVIRIPLLQDLLDPWAYRYKNYTHQDILRADSILVADVFIDPRVSNIASQISCHATSD